MAKQLPKRVLVVGTWWDVRVATEAAEPRLKGSSGVCIASETLLLIRKDSLARQWETFLHELVHAVCEETGFGHDLPKMRKHRLDIEEAFARRVVPVYLAVLHHARIMP